MFNSIDLSIYELKNKIIADLNESGLPVSVMEYVVKEVVDTVTAKKVETLNQLLREKEANSVNQEPIIVEQVEEV